jgi:hypothetical protein
MSPLSCSSVAWERALWLYFTALRNTRPRLLPQPSLCSIHTTPSTPICVLSIPHCYRSSGIAEFVLTLLSLQCSFPCWCTITPTFWSEESCRCHKSWCEERGIVVWIWIWTVPPKSRSYSLGHQLGAIGRYWNLEEVFSSLRGKHVLEGTQAPSMFWPSSDWLCSGTCSTMMCCLATGPKSSRANQLWTGTYETMCQNKPFLSVS